MFLDFAQIFNKSKRLGMNLHPLHHQHHHWARIIVKVKPAWWWNFNW